MFIGQLNIAPRAGRELGYVRSKLDPIKYKEGMLRYIPHPTSFSSPVLRLTTTEQPMWILLLVRTDCVALYKAVSEISHKTGLGDRNQ